MSQCFLNCCKLSVLTSILWYLKLSQSSMLRKKVMRKTYIVWLCMVHYTVDSVRVICIHILMRILLQVSTSNMWLMIVISLHRCKHTYYSLILACAMISYKVVYLLITFYFIFALFYSFNIRDMEQKKYGEKLLYIFKICHRNNGDNVSC